MITSSGSHHLISYQPYFTAQITQTSCRTWGNRPWRAHFHLSDPTTAIACSLASELAEDGRCRPVDLSFRTNWMKPWALFGLLRRVPRVKSKLYNTVNTFQLPGIEVRQQLGYQKRLLGEWQPFFVAHDKVKCIWLLNLVVDQIFDPDCFVLFLLTSLPVGTGKFIGTGFVNNLDRCGLWYLKALLGTSPLVCLISQCGSGGWRVQGDLWATIQLRAWIYYKL